MVELAFDRELGFDDRRAVPRLPNQVGQPMIALRSDHEIDCLLAPDDLAALGLGDAARDRNSDAPVRRGFLDLANLAQFGVDLFRRALANVTGIEHDQIGVFDDARLGEPLGCHDVRHAGRIIAVHLAAKRPDEQLAAFGTSHAELSIPRRGE